MDATLTANHIHEYIKLWVQLQGIQHQEDIDDAILWNLTSNGNTPRPRLIMLNSLEAKLLLSTRWFEKLGHHLRLNSSLV
jgi:hypothetical protein